MKTHQERAWRAIDDLYNTAKRVLKEHQCASYMEIGGEEMNDCEECGLPPCALCSLREAVRTFEIVFPAAEGGEG